jgi:hypothetical protein
MCRPTSSGGPGARAMGFEEGWGTALEQLVAMIKRGI